MRKTAVCDLPILCTTLAMLFLAGCGGSGRPELVPVEGTVTLNGEPLSDANVYFQVVDVAGDYQRPSSGKTDAQGKFTIGTYGATDGMPLGTYKVGVVKKELLGDPQEINWENPAASGKPIRYRWDSPRKYADPAASGLTAEVTSEGLEPATFALEGEGGEVEVVGAGSAGA